MDALAICLRAIALELLSEEQRGVVSKYCLADGADRETVEAVFGVMPTPED